MTDKTTENFLSTEINDDEIDIGKIFRFLMMQSKLIISIVFIAFTLSFAYYISATKNYSIKSLLQYEAFDQNVFDPSQALQIRPPNSSADISNMIELYESRTNYLKVIQDLKLNITINGLNDDESIDINITTEKNDPIVSKRLRFSFSENDYSLLDEDYNEIQTSKYGQQILYNDLRITINSASLREFRPLEINFMNPQSMYSSFKNRMNVQSLVKRNSFFRNEGLITVSYVTADINLGKEIVNYANYIFLNQRINDENEKSRKAISFIEKNIKSIKESVETNKLKLKQFREDNKSIDVSLEIKAIINKIQSLDSALGEIDIEIAKAGEIYTSNNPAYLNLINKKTLIELQKDEVLSEIEMMPKEQQEYIDLFNDLEVSQALFEQLESRRLGFSILEASTIGDIRVIDNAYVDFQVSPKLLVVMLSTMFGFIFACVIAIVRGFNFLPVSNPAEIFDNNIHLPIIGVIPLIENFESSDELTKLDVAIESLIVNVNSIQKEDANKNLITITSPSPSNGKSTVATKLAQGYAKIGKKVLLVDNDLKRGNIAKSFDKHSISEKTFNSITEATIDNYKIDNNLHVIPRVKGLTNSFQFLFSYDYKEKIKFFKDHFDFVIFDSGPILSVADSSILIEQSDINFLIVRHGINRTNEIKQSIVNYNQINKDIDGIIYNAYSKPKSYYGYYGLYGNYSYQYYAEKYLYESYDYKKED
tara:strand:- start:354 stop:2477 length:2124 start_codon:yes stop_codon:yes gene_type:complete